MDDLVVLGNAVPDEISGGRKSICTVCYSKEHGLVRIYPVPPRAPMKRWNVVSVPLERPSQDTRQESWKIHGSKDEWPYLVKKIKLIDKLSPQKQVLILNKLYDEYGAGCVQDLNDNRLSIGIIKPTILKSYMVDRQSFTSQYQTTLDSDRPFLTIENYKKQPRVRYKCECCKTVKYHDQQILEWGVYEYLRRNPNQPPEKCLGGLHLTDPSYEKYFLVGNQAKYRNSFIVVSVLRRKKQPRQQQLL